MFYTGVIKSLRCKKFIQGQCYLTVGEWSAVEGAELCVSPHPEDSWLHGCPSAPAGSSEH